MCEDLEQSIYTLAKKDLDAPNEEKAFKVIVEHIEEVLDLGMIDKLTEIEPEVMREIIRRRVYLPKEKVGLIVGKYYGKYGERSLCLLSEIQISEEKDAVEICKPLGNIPIFKSFLNKANNEEDGSFDVDWENIINEAKRKIQKQKEEIKKLNDINSESKRAIKSANEEVEKIALIYRRCKESLKEVSGFSKKSKCIDIYERAFQELEPLLKDKAGDYTKGADGVLTRCHKIVLVGGDKKKTKLVEKLAQSDDQTLDPIGAAFRSITLSSYPNHSFDVWDSASSGKFRSLVGLYLRDAELAAICYDPECSEADLSQRFEDCVKNGVEKDKTILVCLGEVEAKANIELEEKMKSKYGFRERIEVSLNNQTQIEELKNKIAEAIVGY